MNKKIVCYFSASGTTEMVASKISNVFDADIFRIEPVNEYSDADLDWTNKNSRSSLEMQDKKSRPSIRNKVSNINEYDTIILGFPVWWYTAPTIINTFIEENDLSGKKVYIFVTSGGSSFAKSLEDLKNTYPNINFVNAKRFDINVSDEEIKKLLV